MTLKFTSIPNKTLAESIDTSAGTFKVSDIKGWDGQDLQASDFGTEAFGAFRNTTNTEIEFFKWDPATIGNNSSTGITITYRGMEFDGDITTEVAGNKKVWIKNNTQVLLGTDTSQVLQYLKEYIDAASIAGAVDGSTVAKGIFEEATQAEIDADTAAGATSARLTINPSSLATSKYGTRLPSADEKNGLAGINNAPSSSNPLATKNDLSDPTVLAPEIVSFSSSGTWTKDSGLKYIIIEGVAAGGGGGYNNNSDSNETASGGGGGGGGYFRKIILASALGATETVTVGSGGGGGTSGSTTGVTGGTTSFGSHASATGGTGGTPTDITDGEKIPGNGGTASNGDINISGLQGNYGIDINGNNGNSRGVRGIGGGTVLAFAGRGGNGGTDGNGQDGEDGLVIVTEYYS